MEHTAELEENINRLRAEKEDLEEYYYAEGRKEGVEFAREADFETLYYVANKVDPYDHPIAKIGIDAYFEDLLATLCDPNLGCYYNEPTPMMRAFVAGWQEGVQKFWGQVKVALN